MDNLPPNHKGGKTTVTVSSGDEKLLTSSTHSNVSQDGITASCDVLKEDFCNVDIEWDGRTYHREVANGDCVVVDPRRGGGIRITNGDCSTSRRRRRHLQHDVGGGEEDVSPRLVGEESVVAKESPVDIDVVVDENDHDPMLFEETTVTGIRGALN